MATSRWEGNVHFWDYGPATPERYEGMDAYHTGSAFIYNEQGFANGIVTIMTGHAELQGTKLADGINRAREFLKDMTQPDLPGTPKDEAKTLKASQTFLFTFDGRKLRQTL